MKIKLYISIIVILLSMTGTMMAQYRTEFHVAKDGSGDFEFIQEAIDNCKSFPSQRISIHIKKGTYREKIRVSDWNPNISLIGESRDSTIIVWDDFFSGIDRGRNSTFFTPTLAVHGHFFYAKNLTIINDSQSGEQAVSLAIHSDQCIIENCKIIGNQDTLFLTGTQSRQYFKNCRIEGTTDFIFGDATAYFEDCKIISKANSYITAPASSIQKAHGFVFHQCHLESLTGVDKVYLGRPWREHAKVAFINCKMEDHILPEGWHDWGSKEKAKSCFFAELENSGPGSDISKRVKWSKKLNINSLTAYSREEVLKQYNLNEFNFFNEK